MTPEQKVETVILYLDADVAAWLQRDEDRGETRANQIFRERMLEELKGA